VLPARLEFLEPEPYAAAATKAVTSIDVGANLGDCADEPRSGAAIERSTCMFLQPKP